MNLLSSENIQQFVEHTAKASVDAVKSQAGYMEEWAGRSAKLFTTLADAQWSGLKELASAKTFSQAFEANLAFTETVREEVTHLREENLKAWNGYQEDLKSIFTPKTKPSKKAALKKAA